MYLDLKEKDVLRDKDKTCQTVVHSQGQDGAGLDRGDGLESDCLSLNVSFTTSCATQAY